MENLETVTTIEFIKDTFEEYLGNITYISASDIKNFLKSPAYYHFKKYEEKNSSKEDQRYFAIGSAIHEVILEPHLFESNYIICPKIDKRTKEGKLQYESFLLSSEGKTILFEDEMEMIKKISEQSIKNETFVELIKDSYKEVSCYTTDKKTGLEIKCRPDMLSKTKSTITDIKSCPDSSYSSFKKSVYQYGYSISAAFYMDFLGKENYVFAAVEKQAPYQIALYCLSDEMINYGREQYRMALDLLKWSYDNNYWCSHNEFEILKECYNLENLDSFFDTLKKSELITILY
jgi:exodeoxyribonuclease VIII